MKVSINRNSTCNLKDYRQALREIIWNCDLKFKFVRESLLIFDVDSKLERPLKYYLISGNWQNSHFWMGFQKFANPSIYLAQIGFYCACHGLAGEPSMM